MIINYYLNVVSLAVPPLVEHIVQYGSQCELTTSATDSSCFAFVPIVLGDCVENLVEGEVLLMKQHKSPCLISSAFLPVSISQCDLLASWLPAPMFKRCELVELLFEKQSEKMDQSMANIEYFKYGIWIWFTRNLKENKASFAEYEDHVCKVTL